MCTLVAETVVKTVAETVVKTVAETVVKTVAETVTETVAETVPAVRERFSTKKRRRKIEPSRLV
jgi:hypothetical protein